MSWVLVAALLAADGEPVAEQEPRATVWVQPIGSLVRLLPMNPQVLYASLGFTIAVQQLELATEVTGWDATEITPVTDAEPEIRRRALMLAIGPVFHTGAQRFGGFFVQPKLIGELGYVRGGSPFGSAQLGATAGWQLRWKRLYLAVCVGASVGVGNIAGQSSGPFTNSRGRPGTWGFQWGLDFNLLRIGVVL